MKLLSFLLFASLAGAQTNIAISNTPLQTGVKPAGINIGQPVTYGSFQVLKNLIAYTPGFQDTVWQSSLQCVAGSGTGGCVIYNGSGFPSGFWPNGSAIYVLTGSATGCTTTSSGFSGSFLSFASSCAISSGDSIVATKQLTPATIGSNYHPADNWSIVTGGGGTLTASSSAPPAANGSTYSRSVQMATTTGTDSVYLTYTFDNGFVQPTGSIKSVIDLNGSYTFSYWAKAAVAGQQVFIRLSRGSTAYLATTDTLTTSWTQYTHTISLSETGDQSANGTLTYNFATTGSTAETINISKCYFGESAGDPNGFRSSVVTLLQNAKVGSLRFWDGETLTGPISNFLVDQWAQQPYGSLIASSGDGSGVGYSRGVTYSYPAALGLCQAVGNTECWLVLPVTLSSSDAAYLIQYLAGNSGTAGGAYRISQGYTTPWTQVIPKIHLEFGNEPWNGGFSGGNFDQNYPAYGTLAETVFAAMKADASYDSTHLSLVLDGWAVVPAFTQAAQDNVTHNDEVDVAAYTNNNISDSNFTDVWAATLAEPQVYWQPGAASGSGVVCAEYQSGVLCPSNSYFKTGSGTATYYGGTMYLNGLMAGYGHAGTAKQLSVYEQNFSTIGTSGAGSSGGFTQAQMNQFFSANGAGLATAEQILTNLANGIKTQNLFQLPQYYFNGFPSMSAGASYYYGWGSVVDIGGATNLQRPQLVAESAVNAVIPFGGTMLTTTQTGTPTYSVGNPSSGATINTVATAAVNTVLSYAFNSGSNYSLVMLNLDQTSTHAVTFSGALAPTGTVSVNVVNSANLTDNNETAANYAGTASTVSSPTGYTLPAHSLVTLTWSTSTTPTISCPASVVAGGQITCTATGTVTWSVTGGGSINSSTGVYTAPTGVVAQNSMLGVNVMPNDVIFNTRIDNASFPLDSNSATKIATLPSTTLTIQPAWGISYADSGTATRNLLGYYNEVSYTGFPNQTSPSLLYRENGNKVGVFNNSSDHHSMIVNRSTGTFHETYNDYLSGYTRTCNDGSTANCNVQSATTYASTAYTFPSTASYNNGTDAAGLPLAPLVWHLDELKSGVINHAVRVTWNGQFNAGTFVWPASAYAGGTSGSPTTRTQLGDRLRLKSAYSITGACGTSPAAGSAGYYCTVGLTALAHYGMVIADTGTNNAIIVASDVESDPAVTAGLQMIAAAAIAPTNFEIVNEQALKVAANNYIVAPQSYATPLNQIVVSGSGASNTVNVAIQPIGVGSTLNASLYLEAGSYTVSLSPFFWVVPSSVSQTINYAIANNTCSSGSISGSALTVPTTGGCTLQITATSAYDSAAVTTRYVTVLAVGTSPANSVRIDSGKTTSTTDLNGNIWAADLGMIGQQAQNGSDNAWPQTNPYLTVYQSDDYSQQDLHYEMLVPNGNYQIQLLFGKLHEGGGCNNQPCGTWPTISSGYYPLLGYLPIWIETQGSMVSNTLDWGGQQGYLYTTPYSAFVPATVSNNLLEVGVGMYAPDSGPNYSGTNYGQSGNKYVTVNGISVLPDTTSAYLTVDPAANAPNMRVAAGGSTQPFYPVAHYFSGGTTTWAVGTNTTGLSASITSDGWGDGGMVLSLGSGTAKNGQVVTVIATNGSYISPAMAFYVSGASTTLTQNPLDPATSSSFSSVTAGMTQIASYTFGTNSGRNMQNATNLATAFSRYGIAGSTVINNQYQVFTPFTATANYVFDAADLNLAATATALTVGSINSGQIATNATYGPPGAPGQPNVIAFEVNAQISGDQGEWPAIWLFKPTNNGPTGTQELSRPESDFEFFIGGYGFTNATQLTAFDHLTQSQLPSYAGTGIPQANTAGTFYSLLTGCSNQCYSPGTDFSAGFHNYQIVWTPDAIYKYVDGILVKAIAFKWTSPTGAQLLISHQVGNSSVSGFAPTSLGQFPSNMKVEHISVWQQ